MIIKQDNKEHYGHMCDKYKHIFSIKENKCPKCSDCKYMWIIDVLFILFWIWQAMGLWGLICLIRIIHGG